VEFSGGEVDLVYDPLPPSGLVVAPVCVDLEVREVARVGELGVSVDWGRVFVEKVVHCPPVGPEVEDDVFCLALRWGRDGGAGAEVGLFHGLVAEGARTVDSDRKGVGGEQVDKPL